MNGYSRGLSTVHEHWLAALPSRGCAAAGFDRPGTYWSSTAPGITAQAAGTRWISPGMNVVTRGPGCEPALLWPPPCTSATTATTAPTPASPPAGHNHGDRRLARLRPPAAPRRRC